MSRAVVQMTIEDALHYTPDQRQAIIDSYPNYERDARVRGIPSMGSGRVFPVADDTVLCEPTSIPPHWPQIIGVDFGWDHPFAAIKLAWDRDNDTIYVTSEYAERQATPVTHSAAIKPWGAWIPVAWPHDGLQHDKGSGDELAKLYREQGLNMMTERATYADGGSGVEAGVMDMLDRMRTGRWKVFNNCQGWMKEFRLYHRKDGKIEKIIDDRISASRYAVMMLRKATTLPSQEPLKRRIGGYA